MYVTLEIKSQMLLCMCERTHSWQKGCCDVDTCLTGGKEYKRQYDDDFFFTALAKHTQFNHNVIEIIFFFSEVCSFSLLKRVKSFSSSLIEEHNDLVP